MDIGTLQESENALLYIQTKVDGHKSLVKKVLEVVDDNYINIISGVKEGNIYLYEDNKGTVYYTSKKIDKFDLHLIFTLNEYNINGFDLDEVLKNLRYYVNLSILERIKIHCLTFNIKKIDVNTGTEPY